MRVPALIAGAFALCAIAPGLVLPRAVHAGVVNPNISVIGQPVITYTTDPSNPDAKRPRLDVGETEFMFDSYLNPYAYGTFIASLTKEGVDLEEGYFTLLRGLPAGLTLKGGKYRVGFGKLNPVHPHAYPFAERPHVLAAYLPGTESFDETGVSLSGRLPAPGDVALTWTGDWLQGDTFRIARVPSSPDSDGASLSRPAFVGRFSAFIPAGDRSGIELGASAADGTNNVAAKARTRLWGADAKAKLWNSPSSYLVVQGELIALHRDDAGWDAGSATYTRSTVNADGGYLFADYQMDQRRDFGASYERYEEPAAGKPIGRAWGVFGGYSLMEETTVFRLGWERFDPQAGSTVNSVTCRVLYSMGPHKAHQF